MSNDTPPTNPDDVDEVIDLTDLPGEGDPDIPAGSTIDPDSFLGKRIQSGTPGNCGDPACPGCTPSAHTIRFRELIAEAYLETWREMDRLLRADTSSYVSSVVVLSLRSRHLVGMFMPKESLEDGQIEWVNRVAVEARRYLMRHQLGMSDDEIARREAFEKRSTN